MLANRSTNKEKLHSTFILQQSLEQHHQHITHSGDSRALAEFEGTDRSPKEGKGQSWDGLWDPAEREWAPEPWGSRWWEGIPPVVPTGTYSTWDTPLSDNHTSNDAQVHVACGPQEWWLFGGVCVSAGLCLRLEARTGYESRAGVSPALFWKITPFFLAGYQNVFPSACCSFLSCVSMN